MSSKVGKRSAGKIKLDSYEDLFGSEENYVLPVQQLVNEDDLRYICTYKESYIVKIYVDLEIREILNDF